MTDVYEQLAFYKRELGFCDAAAKTISLAASLGVTPAQARLLAAMYRANRPLSHAILLDHLGAEVTANCLSVHLHHVKQRLGRAVHDIPLPGFYALTSEGRRLVGAALA